MFIDEVEITVRAGRGGDGCIAFLREKYRPLGGPAGGDGGRGGSVVLRAHPGLRTLANFRGRRILVAKSGKPGENRNCHGRGAKNLVVDVPVGTIVRDAETNEIFGDLTRPRQKLIIAAGGKGGRGNAHFKSPTHRTPRKSERGTSGEERKLTLELRLLADVGLVGLPNVGKSTLIGVVSTVRPKVANYPFTTLLPSVGVVRLGDFASFTMADIPGLIELAHEGKGLGHQFLRHIRRTSLICHLIEFPLYIDEIAERVKVMAEAYRTIRKELEEYDDELARKPEIVCWTKADILTADELADIKNRHLEAFISDTGCPGPVNVISAVRGDGVGILLGRLSKLLELDITGARPKDASADLVEGDAPKGLSAAELTMDRLDEPEPEPEEK